MTRFTMLPAALAAGALMMLPAAAQPEPERPDPLVRAGATEAISEHVHVILDEGVPMVPNVGFIVGDDAALVIETGLGAQNGATVLAEAEKVAPGRALYIVSTHFHPEHDLGAQAFPESAQVIRSTAQIQEIAESGEATIARFSGFSPVIAGHLEGAAHRAADITFTDEHVLDHGGVTARIIAMGPNHTLGDTAVYVVEDDVLFSGDVAMGRPPSFASPHSSLAQWLSSLDRFDALAPAIIVPAHGPTGDAAFIEGYRSHLTEIRDRTAALKADGKSVDEAVEAVAADMNGDGRMAGAIRAAYAEAP
jgi:glyoxylase-like metal-dependent hydrolase (beta-lactamase superfamily II)